MTQKVNKLGETVAVTGFAAALPNGSTLAHEEYVTGRYDWVSYDGVKQDGTVRYGKDLITFDGDVKGRYPRLYDRNDFWVELLDIVVNGKRVFLDGIVSGIALRKVKLTGEEKSTVYIVYAAAEHMLDRTTNVTFYSVPLRAALKPGAAATPMGSAIVPGLVAQPFFFDGKGEKCVSYALDPYVDDSTVVAYGEIMHDGAQFSATVSLDGFSKYLSTVNTENYNFGGTQQLFGVDITADSQVSHLTQKQINESNNTSVQYGTGDISGYHNTGTGRHVTTINMGDTELLQIGDSGWGDIELDLTGNHHNYSDISQHRAAVYDVDLRHNAAVWVTFTVTTSFKQLLSGGGAGYVTYTSHVVLPSELTLHAKFGADEQAKVIRGVPGLGSVPPGIVNTLMSQYFPVQLFLTSFRTKLFASRNENSYMLCATTPKARTPGSEPYFVGVDLEPIVMQKTPPHGAAGKPIDHEKLGVAEDTAVWHFPITLIHSLNAAKA